MINSCSTSISQIKYPTTISPPKPSILTQQITADFQLSQEAWNQLSKQINEIVDTNKLLKMQYSVHIKTDKHAETESQNLYKHKENFMMYLDDTFYQQAHTLSNLEYANLKLSNFAVKLHNCDPIIPLLDTGAKCSCILYQDLMTISDKGDIIRKTLCVILLLGQLQV